MLNVLVAYPYFTPPLREILRRFRGSYRLLVDSGAFTAWISGKPIDLDAYCRFLDTLVEFAPYEAIQLDVVQNEEGTARNLEIMESRGYSTLPVWTRGASWARYVELEAKYPYICLGGVAKGEGNQAFVKWFHGRNPKANVHWLGMTDPAMTLKYRPFSIDSSSWANAGRFGALDYFEGWQGKKLRRSVATPSQWGKARRYFEGIGAIIPPVLDREDWVNSRPPQWLRDSAPPARGKSLIFALSNIAWAMYAERVERRLGTRLFFSGGSEIEKMLLARQWLEDRGQIIV